jgi:hypothetical protein
LSSHEQPDEGEQSHRAHKGEDHAGAELRGADLSGAQLTGADFREADLRGADFRGAHLAGADFRDARLGLRPMASATLFAVALLVALVAGVATGMAAEMVRDRLATSQWQDVLTLVAVWLVLVIFLAALLLRGPKIALLALVATLIIEVIAGWTIMSTFGEFRPEVVIQMIALILIVAAAFMAGIIGRVLGGVRGGVGVMVVAVSAGLIAGGAGGSIGVVVASLIIVMLAKRALKGDQRDRPVVLLAQRIIRLRATNFARADLSGADFSGTNIAHCDTTGALVEGVTWGVEDENQASA